MNQIQTYLFTEAFNIELKVCYGQYLILSTFASWSNEEILPSYNFEYSILNRLSWKLIKYVIEVSNQSLSCLPYLV